MIAEYLNSSKTFRPWLYFVSHKSFLIRSSKSDNGSSENIDVMFWGVFYAEFPHIFNGIKIVTPVHEELTRLEEKCKSGYPDLSKVYYELQSQGQQFYIGASGIRIENNTLPLGEHHLFS